MPLTKAREMMEEALTLARAAAAAGEVPVGAVVVKDGVISGVGLTSRYRAMTRLPTPKSSRCARQRRFWAMTG
jgi:tRNA(Arg) A34 adenosine deaminase TadA